MIKKLRWRFISTAMLAFFLVIALIAGLVNIAFYCVETQRIDQTLDSIINYDAYRPRFDGRGGGFSGPDGRGGHGGHDGNGQDNMPPMEQFMALPNEEENYMTRFFIVTLDENNMIVESSLDYIASVDEDDLLYYTDSAMGKISWGDSPMEQVNSASMF